MPIYPSLEDFNAADLIEQQAEPEVTEQDASQNLASATAVSEEVSGQITGRRASNQAYPPLRDIMRLELSDDLIRANMPEYLDPPEQDESNTIIGDPSTSPAETKGSDKKQSKLLAFLKPDKGLSGKDSKKTPRGKIGIKVRGLASGDWVRLRTSDNMCIQLERAH